MLDLTLPLSLKKMHLIANDAKKCAKAANLIYVTNIEKGIERIRKRKEFVYYFEGTKITDSSTIDRIKKLAIPPAWEHVWICPHEAGHLQATGLDVRKRKQYRYHAQWNNLRNQTKFSKLLSFGEKLPQLRLQLEKDLSRRELCPEKILAAAISVMERTYIRIGNSEYEKANGSYGLTTLKDQHVKFEGNNIQFSFKGKKGIAHKIKLNNPKLAGIIKQSRDIPGKELFQYYDEQSNPHPIDSGMVNRYIQEITGEEFTAKDFRTWAGTLNALDAFKKSGDGSSITDTKRKINEALDYVSKKLGNTRSVCKKYYVHPLIIGLFEQQTLTRTYLKELDKIEKNDNLTGWTQSELLLLKILKSNS
jgi:DNA topoisomerase I